MALVEAFPLREHLDVCRIWPADFDGFGRGMRCTEAVPKGEEFLAVDLEKCWTADAARKCPEIAALDEEILSAISDASLMVLHILVVRAQGDAAEACRREHINMLKSAEFETLMDWTEEELKSLTGSKWAMIAPACRQDIEDEFVELLEVLPEFFSTHDIDVHKFLWAHRVLISRAVNFFMEDGSMLFVLGAGQDLLNHSLEVPVGNDDVQLRRSDETGQRLLVVRACRDYQEGEQAFFSYSDASNGRLLMMAGFVLPENPYDTVELAFTFPVTSQTLPLYYSLGEGLEAGLQTPGVALSEDTKPEFLETQPPEAENPTEIVFHIRLSKENARLKAQLERVLAFFRLQGLCRNGSVPSAETLATSDGDPEGRAEALRVLKSSLMTMLKAYPSSLEEDLAALPTAMEIAPSSKKARREAMALQVVIGEKRIFKMALDLLEM